MKHYVLNLKRRPDKLASWIGAMDQAGYDFEDFTVFEAINAQTLTDRDMIDIACALHPRYASSNLSNVKETIFYEDRVQRVPHFAMKLGCEAIWTEIANAEDDIWHCVWLDDVVFAHHMTYEKYVGILSELPRDAEVVIGNRGQLYADIDETVPPPMQHPRMPFFIGGIVTSLSDLQMAIKPTGARKLLQMTIPQCANMDVSLRHAEQFDKFFIFTPYDPYIRVIEHIFDRGSDILPEDQQRLTPVELRRSHDDAEKTSIDPKRLNIAQVIENYG